jgi:hypothetical protein
LIVSTDDDGDVDSSDDLASEGDSDGSEDASFFPKNDGSFHARHRTDDRAARPGYDAIRAGVDAARWARAPRARRARAQRGSARRRRRRHRPRGNIWPRSGRPLDATAGRAARLRACGRVCAPTTDARSTS